MKEEEEKSVDSQLWHACAGSMVHIPTVNSTAIYFPQGHIEHAQLNTTNDFPGRGFPPQILCRVELVKFLAKPDTDEVYAKIRLNPLQNDNHPVVFKDTGVLGSGSRSSENLGSSFAKTLTPSDADIKNYVGALTVPRSGAERIFPPLDYKADRSVQMLVLKDIHCKTWTLRHTYSEKANRHMLTTGWRSFVKKKKLVAGDTILFLKSENGDLRVGIRRAERDAIRFGRGDEEKAEAVRQAMTSGTSGQVFDVFYYPRPNTSAFCVEEEVVKAALRVSWRSGTRFKKAFESADSQLISWRKGTVSAVQQWPDFSWNLLQVVWDEPDLVPNLNQVNPWEVKLIPDTPKIEFSTYYPSKGQPSLPENNHHPVTPTIGVQGARHDQYGASDLSDAEKPDENNSSQNLEKVSHDKKTKARLFTLSGTHMLIDQLINPQVKLILKLCLFFILGYMLNVGLDEAEHL